MYINTPDVSLSYKQAFFTDELYDPISHSRNVWEEDDDAVSGYPDSKEYYDPIFKVRLVNSC